MVAEFRERGLRWTSLMFQQHAVFRIFPNSTPFIIDDVVIHEGVVLSKVSKISREIFVFMTWICQIELIVFIVTVGYSYRWLQDRIHNTM